MDIMVEFILFADNFPVDEVIKHIGISYNEKINKRDVLLIGPNKDIPRVQEVSSIEYSTGYIKTIDVNQPIEKIYNLLHPCQKQIIESVEKYNLHAKFCIIINLSDNPIIRFSRKFIDLVSAVHAYIDIDSYVNYDKKGRPIIK